nr:MAG TPA: hypothetical protein [Caudoviricetes sp.]
MPLFCGWAARLLRPGRFFRPCKSVPQFTIKIVFLSCFKNIKCVHLNYRGKEESHGNETTRER